jgi:hypothetical protein
MSGKLVVGGGALVGTDEGDRSMCSMCTSSTICSCSGSGGGGGGSSSSSDMDGRTRTTSWWAHRSRTVYLAAVRLSMPKHDASQVTLAGVSCVLVDGRQPEKEFSLVRQPS